MFKMLLFVVCTLMCILMPAFSEASPFRVAPRASSRIQAALSIKAVAAPASNDDLPAFADTPITNTSASLENTASAAIEVLLGYVDSSFTFSGLRWWHNANGYTAIFDFDLFTGGTRYESTAGQDLLNLIAKGQPDGTPGLINVYNDDSMWWALACLEAYDAYGDSKFLSPAEGIWNWVNSTSLVTQTGIAPDMGGIQREYVLSDKCELENGVYWTTAVDETYINSITTGLFMQTSARLYEISKDQKYLTAAQSAMGWLEEHTVDASVELVSLDGVNGTTCAIQNGAYSYNTGVFIGALVSLYKTTGNESYLEYAEQAAASAMVTTFWTDGNGMITESQTDRAGGDGVEFKSILLRNLMRLYLATSSDTLKQEIRGFVNVNYNSLYNKARSGNNYDVDWYGPFMNKTSWGELVAVDLLNAGMVVNGAS